MNASKRKSVTAKGLSIHGQLALVFASELRSGAAAKYAQWMGAMPTQEEMRRDMPIFWQEDLRHCLTDPAKGEEFISIR